ncbi:hypothetical protein EIN_277940 [Entamoeba invadens IP1]|uniref:Uncharacterized protein n=1 Tax=Entamoeba invadens IP1 TaxID=370355 RepID=A0A0A1TVD5_ENTIV|nr:hypothetical protein EIN_277940 [Entamoeba invadens IP1]ELP84344.1 hypothetical protein EIN_277940 [Entamoeba invadens IP1]|eukprot:XP_004183690.1 hypothetical protein EIN_277940 [Entamoeba invadens IP1]
MSANLNRDSQRFIEQRNLQTYLECTILAILSYNTEIQLIKPQKLTKHSQPFIKIKKLMILNDDKWSLEIDTIVKERIKAIEKDYKNSGVAKNTAFRRSLNHKKRDMMHIVEDIIYEWGYTVRYEGENREGIYGNVEIEMPNGKLINKKRIVDIDQRVWEYLRVKMVSSKLHYNDTNFVKC